MAGLRTWLIHLPRIFKRTILTTNDLVLVECCLLAAFYFRLGWSPVDLVKTYLPVFLVTPIVVLIFLERLKLYSSVTRHAGVEVMSVIARGVSFGVLVVLLVFFLIPVQPQLPRSVLLVFWVLSIFALFSARLIAGRWLHGTSISRMLMAFAGWKHRRRIKGVPVIVYGAGEAGRQLASALTHGARFTPIGFIDDDSSLQGEIAAGLKVFAPDELEEISQSYPNLEVFLAMPSAPRSRRQDIIRFLEPLDVHVRSVPSMDELAQGVVQVDAVREVDVADILGREAVSAEQALLDRTISGKNILVTGAGGSIGSELSRQIFKHHPRKLVLLDHSEFNLYNLFSELEEALDMSEIAAVKSIEVIPVIGSVLDGDLVASVLRRYRVDTVYHAAAYKHVPLVEVNGYQGFVNNVFGTLHLARAAMESGVERFVLVSTDKAVRPTNLMGATKRLSELALQAFSQLPEINFSGLGIHGITQDESMANRTLFTMVRFGNVLDSSGSVIPKFRKQIKAGGPVTVTHKEVTRYFMTIPEASELVLQANALSNGGDVFILDMGKPVKIDDLARKLINLSGLTLRDERNPDGDIEIIYTGIRPGEKLYEELLIDDSALPTEHAKIWRANERVIGWDELKGMLVELDDILRSGDTNRLKALLSRPEIGYQLFQEGN